MTITAQRYHDFSYGHRVVGHEGKCCNLHGHNGRVTFYCEASGLDDVGRVVDFSVIKSTMCQWLEDNWDHKMLIWQDDPLADSIKAIDSTVVIVPFNPTAENMADFLLNQVGRNTFAYTPITLVRVDFSETRKCSATVSREGK